MEVAYYGGAFIDIHEKVIPIQERGHQFGDGVYEVIRVYDGHPFMMEEHLDRLEMSANEILLKMPLTRTEIKEIAAEGLQRAGIKEAEIYIQVTRGIAARNHLFPDVPAQFAMTIRQAKQFSPEKRQHGVSVTLLEDERWANCFIKSLNLLPNVIAKQKAVTNGHEEAVLVRQGFVTEGSSSNVFAIKDGILYTTPATKRILHGITRSAVIACAEKLGIPVVEKEMDVDFFTSADEAFFTSTSVEIMPIAKVDEKVLPADRPITNKLHKAYQALYQAVAQ
ncbi:aminotransferase class IV [Bacillus songklensis]|uniref:Aminotransferase class IV n=1 Tax=Bacillus songklensis TaxID=1069116 RepID=A0ABV8B6Q8_9BACI